MKKNSMCLIVFTFFLVQMAFGSELEQHEIDSIKNVNRTLIDQEQLVDNYNALSYLFGGLSTDSSLVYSNKAIVLAKQINYNHGLGVGHLYLARGLAQNGEMIVSFENYQKALEQFIKQKDTVNLLDCYRGMSYLASYGASKLQSLKYNMKALELAELIKDSVSLSIIYNNIGSIYHKLDNYESAKYYYENSLSIDSVFNVPKELAMTYSNLGVLKMKFHKYEEASVDYANLLKVLPHVTVDYVRAYMYLSLAGYYTEIGKYDTSNHFIKLATDICVKNNYLHIQTRAYRRMGELKIKQLKYKEGIAYLDKCIALSDSIGIKEEFPKVFKLEAQAYSALGSYKKAYEYSQMAIQAIDSLKTKSVANFLEEFEEQMVRNELDRKNMELALKDQQNANSTMKMRLRLELALAVIALLLLLVSIVIYFLIRIRHKKKILNEQHKLIQHQKGLLELHLQKLKVSEDSLQKLNTAKDTFFSIIAHDLRSPFNAIIGFSDVLSKNYNLLDDAKRKNMIENVGNSAKSTLALLDNLLAWARSQGGHLKLIPESYPLNQLVEEGLMGSKSVAEIKKIVIIRNFEDNVDVFVDRETIKVVISNLFNNAIKFSHIGGKILITTNIENGFAELCFHDFGIGMSRKIKEGIFAIDREIQREGTSNEKGTGLGLVLCKEFIVQNGGQIRVESTEGQGSVFCVSLPMNDRID